MHPINIETKEINIRDCRRTWELDEVRGQFSRIKDGKYCPITGDSFELKKTCLLEYRDFDGVSRWTLPKGSIVKKGARLNVIVPLYKVSYRNFLATIYPLASRLPIDVVRECYPWGEWSLEELVAGDEQVVVEYGGIYLRVDL